MIVSYFRKMSGVARTYIVSVRRVLVVCRCLFNTGELNHAEKAKILLLCHDNNRGYNYNGKKYSQLLDTINEKLMARGVKTITLATPLSFIDPSSAFGNVLIINGLLLRAILLDKLIYHVTGKARVDNYRVKAWTRIFRKIEPAVVIGIQPTPEMCIAARAENVVIYDLQHGLVGNDAGYYGNSYRDKYGQRGWPDCILCWDQESADVIGKCTGSSVKFKVVGNPWFMRFKFVSSDDDLVAIATNSLCNDSASKIILVTTQWGMGQHHGFHVSGIPQSLLDTMRMQRQGVTWWLRLHPVQIQEPAKSSLYKQLEFEFSGCNNVVWEPCSESPLPVVLSKVSLHLTSHSGVTVEASWYGIPTGLLYDRRDLLNEWLSKEISTGIAEILNADSKSINDWIDRNLSKSKHVFDCSNDLTKRNFAQFIDDMVALHSTV